MRFLKKLLTVCGALLVPTLIYSVVTITPATPNYYMEENIPGTNGCYQFNTSPTCSASIVGLSSTSLPSGATFYIQNTLTPGTSTQQASLLNIVITSSTILPGTTFYQSGQVQMGTAGQSVSISSNTILPGTTAYADGTIQNANGITSAGAITANNFNSTGSSIPKNGWTQSAANTVTFYTNSVPALTLTPNQAVQMSSNTIMAGATFYADGHSVIGSTLTAGALQDSGLANTLVLANGSGIFVSTTITTGVQPNSTTTWTATQNFTSFTVSTFTTTGSTITLNNVQYTLPSSVGPGGYFKINTSSGIVVSSNVVVSSTTNTNINFPSTGNIGDLLSVSLATGTWLCSDMLFTTANGGTITDTFGGMSTTSGNSATGLVAGQSYAETSASANIGETIFSLSVPPVQFIMAATTTLYLKYSGTFSVATPLARGSILCKLQ